MGREIEVRSARMLELILEQAEQPAERGEDMPTLLRRPADLLHLNRLRRKQAEYHQRLVTASTLYERLDAMYKWLILTELLEAGQFNLVEFAAMTPERIYNAMVVEADYIATGGRRLSGGTGL